MTLMFMPKSWLDAMQRPRRWPLPQCARHDWREQRWLDIAGASGRGVGERRLFRYDGCVDITASLAVAIHSGAIGHRLSRATSL